MSIVNVNDRSLEADLEPKSAPRVSSHLELF